MALSLEVKKFINSEHVGKFVEIHLPLEGEPVRPPKKNKKAPAEPQPEDVEKTQPEPLPPQEEEDPAFETLRIHYMDEGDGEPLVLVHTIGQSIYTWRCLYASLTQHYRVIAVDMPGFGYSSRPDVYSYTIEEQSKALELFLDAIGIESAHFMGFSMGCAYVMDLCLRQPERAGRVILLMDRSKLGRTLPFTFAELEDIDVFICDGPLPQLRAAAQAAHVELVEA